MNVNVPVPIPRRSHRSWFKWQHCPRRGLDYLDNVWLQTKYIAPKHKRPASQPTAKSKKVPRSYMKAKS